MNNPYDAPGTQAFRNMFGPAENSPIGGNAGDSHFGYVQPLNIDFNPNYGQLGWHITTDVPGLGQGMPIRIHDFLADLNP